MIQKYFNNNSIIIFFAIVQQKIYTYILATGNSTKIRYIHIIYIKHDILLPFVSYLKLYAYKIELISFRYVR